MTPAPLLTYLVLTLCPPQGLATETITLGPVEQFQCTAFQAEITTIAYESVHPEYAGYRLIGWKCSARKEGSA